MALMFLTFVCCTQSLHFKAAFPLSCLHDAHIHNASYMHFFKFCVLYDLLFFVFSPSDST